MKVNKRKHLENILKVNMRKVIINRLITRKDDKMSRVIRKRK